MIEEREMTVLTVLDVKASVTITKYERHINTKFYAPNIINQINSPRLNAAYSRAHTEIDEIIRNLEDILYEEIELKAAEEQKKKEGAK